MSALLVLFVAFTLLPEEASGIPAFARRYKLSCTTCHAPFPRLKSFGDEFAAAGFVIAEEEKDRDYVTAGDELLWLNRTFQLGARLDAWVNLEDEMTAPESVDSDLQMPWGLKILTGGALAKNIGYYFYFFSPSAVRWQASRTPTSTSTTSAATSTWARRAYRWPARLPPPSAMRSATTARTLASPTAR